MKAAGYNKNVERFWSEATEYNDKKAAEAAFVA